MPSDHQHRAVFPSLERFTASWPIWITLVTIYQVHELVTPFNQATMLVKIISILVMLIAFQVADCQTTPTLAFVSQVYQFPRGYNIENLAVRSNGNILFSRFSKSEIHEWNPSTPSASATIANSFPSGNGCMGIAEVSPDKFAVIVQSRKGFQTMSAVWVLDFTSGKPIATMAADNIVGFLNGMASVTTDIVVASDFLGGDIVSVDLKTGKTAVAHKQAGKGVNGLRIKNGTLYSANYNTGVFGRVSLDMSTGISTGPHQPMATASAGLDDFALSPFSDEAFVVNQYQGEVLRINIGGKDITALDVVAGAKGSVPVTGPTSAQFGRTEKDSHILYVSTNNGKIMAVKL